MIGKKEQDRSAGRGHGQQGPNHLLVALRHPHVPNAQTPLLRQSEKIEHFLRIGRHSIGTEDDSKGGVQLIGARESAIHWQGDVWALT